MTRASSHRAFTLVELLVVIGIIGVLISILLPTLAKARQRGITVQCASNLRQIAMGWQMYVQQYKGIAPPARVPDIRGSRNLYDLGQGPTYRPRWYEMVGAVMKQYPFPTPFPANNDNREIQNQLFLCPAVPDWKNARNSAYGYNYQFLGNARERSDGKYIKWPVNVSKIKASETVLAADSMGSAAGHQAINRRAYRNDGTSDQNAYGNHGYNIDPPRLTETSDYCEWQHRNPQDRSAPDPRHTGRANAVFCDGHVETATMRDLGYVQNASGRVIEDGSVHCLNNKWSGSGRDDDPPSIVPGR